MNIKNILPSLIKKISSVHITLVVVVALTLLLTYVYNNPHNVVLATTIKPESFTELYFENHLELPTLIDEQPKYNTYQFTFTIHNFENRDMKYNYEIYADEKNKILLDQDEVTIKSNESRKITKTISLAPVTKRTKIVVTLLPKDQRIAFWLGGQE